MKKIIIGADPIGFALKEHVKKYLLSLNYDVIDVGTTTEKDLDYYLVGKEVGEKVSSNEFDRGIIFCGTGMGVNIVANKFPGVYCGLCESVTSTRLCRIINNCNVLSLGALITSEYKAIQMVETFLTTEFAKNFELADPDFLKRAIGEIKGIEDEIYKL